MINATELMRLPAEQRKQERYRLLRQPDAQVVVRTGWLRSAAMAVKDVSHGGVSLYLERALPVASRVSIEYAAPALTLNVEGLVAWCRGRQDADTDLIHLPNAWVLGVELFSPVLLLSAFRDALPVHALSVSGI
jgi:hypothetical protein